MDAGGRDLVALRWPPGPGFADELQRLWESGAAVLPLRWDLPAPEVERILALARPAALAVMLLTCLPKTGPLER